MRFIRRKLTRYFIMHCADTYSRMDIGVPEITEWHLKRGMLTVGYHYVIRRDGAIETGRPDDVVGAHCLSQGRNRDSIGICLVGGLGDDDRPEDNFTPAQKMSASRLIKKLKLKYPDAEVAGHGDFDKNRTCPNFDYSYLT